MNDRITLPGVSDDNNALLNGLLKQLEVKKPRNLLRASYYDGKRAIRQVGTVIPPQYYRLGLVLGWSAKAVDILARRCNLDGFVWSDGDLDSLGYREVLDDNFLLAEFSAAAVSSLLHGVVFAVNTVGGNDEPPSLIHFKDALNATGEWDSRTRRLSNLLSITERDGETGDPTALALYLDGETIEANREGRAWQVNVTPHSWGVPAEALPYRPRVGRAMGSSRISRAVMSLHDQALRTVVRLEGHMDVYSFPEMWMLGADMGVFRNPDGTQKPAWQVMLGRIKGIPDDDEAPESLARADVKQFPAASPQPHLDALKQQAQLFSGETSIPLTSLGVSDMSNPTSADSYIASREDLIAEAEGATDDWSPPLRRTMARALAMAAGELSVPEQWRTIDTKWRSPLYLSRAAQADAGVKQLSAVPWLADTDVGLELLGLDEQQISRARADKRRAQSASLVEKLTAAPIPAPPENAAEQALSDDGGTGGF
jgi:hypothetical protein